MHAHNLGVAFPRLRTLKPMYPGLSDAKCWRYLKWWRPSIGKRVVGEALSHARYVYLVHYRIRQLNWLILRLQLYH